MDVESARSFLNFCHEMSRKIFFFSKSKNSVPRISRNTILKSKKCSKIQKIPNSKIERWVKEKNRHEVNDSSKGNNDSPLPEKSIDYPKKIIEKKSTFLFPDEKNRNFFLENFLFDEISLSHSKKWWFLIKTKKIEWIDVLLLSALWLAVEFEIMILSNRDLSHPLIRPVISMCPFPSIHQPCFVRMHLVSCQLIKIKKNSNLDPPIKRMNEKNAFARGENVTNIST